MCCVWFRPLSISEVRYAMNVVRMGLAAFCAVLAGLQDRMDTP
jgi:hypothetical protein